MKLFNQSTLREILERLRDAPQARQSLQAWADMARAASWRNHDDVSTSATHSPDAVGPDRLVFDILHNEFRLIVRVDYSRQWVFIHWFGSHRQYDAIDVKTVERNV